MLEITSGPVTRITLNRPEVRNAFNDELIAELTSAFAGLGAEVRAVVLSGHGKAFCAGGDLEWMRKAAEYSEDENYEDALKLAALFRTIATSHAVVIAKVHGAAFGGGCGLVAASDVAVCAEDARFSFSEVKLGLLPGTISPFVIPKIGAGHARALFSTGEIFGAEKAQRIGLVHEVGAADDLDRLVDEKLTSILLSGPKACAEAKQLVLDAPLSPEESARRLARARAGEEGKEGVAAFLEKRKASFVSEP
ncbi:MAG TPA: enoyl-CoA hydratase-related protein [Fimbriimonadaceae bacterium]|nr:enoyl-CoA hydratase-related protein [Fimbriimonadaceae bacterium]